MTPKREIAYRIRRTRLQKGLLQKEVAAKAGINPHTLRAIESARWCVRLEDAGRIVKVLGLSLDGLVEGVL